MGRSWVRSRKWTRRSREDHGGPASAEAKPLLSNDIQNWSAGDIQNWSPKVATISGICGAGMWRPDTGPRLAGRGRLRRHDVGAGSAPVAPEERPRAAAEPPLLVLPRRVGWVLQTISGTLIPGYELGKMVAEPELAALVAEVPQLGRVLRPLCRMLAVKMPAWLRLPRRCAVRPPRPRPTLIRLGAGQLWRGPSGLWPTREQAEKFDAKILVWPDER